MKNHLIISFILIILLGCTDEYNAKRILENEGYKNIRMTGYKAFMCSEDDTYHTGFVAEKEGRIIKGCVCGGVLKGSTIRLE